MIPTKEFVLSKQAELTSVFSKYSLEEVTLFGSVARGEATENSDIDISFKPGSSYSHGFMAKIAVELEEILGFEVDIVKYDKVLLEIREAIDLEGVLVIGNSSE